MPDAQEFLWEGHSRWKTKIESLFFNKSMVLFNIKCINNSRPEATQETQKVFINKVV